MIFLHYEDTEIWTNIHESNHYFDKRLSCKMPTRVRHCNKDTVLFIENIAICFFVPFDIVLPEVMQSCIEEMLLHLGTATCNQWQQCDRVNIIWNVAVPRGTFLVQRLWQLAGADNWVFLLFCLFLQVSYWNFQEPKTSALSVNLKQKTCWFVYWLPLHELPHLLLGTRQYNQT